MVNEWRELLTAQEYEIFAQIFQRATEVYHLPVKQKPRFAGFGKKNGFYMFWVGDHGEGFYFKARRTYDPSGEENCIKLSLCERDKEAIFEAMEQIYRDSLEKASLFADRNGRRWHKAKGADENCSELYAIWGKRADELFEARAERALSAERISALQDLGERAMASFDRIVSQLLSFGISPRYREIWCYHTQKRASTLRTTADAFGLSHERIRQILNWIPRKISVRFEQCCGRGNFAALDVCIGELLAELELLGEDLNAFVRYALSPFHPKKTELFLTLLFGRKRGAELLAYS